ncbi:MAG: Wzt carbohydrate-binding domain-containing protein, partial [Acidobacteriota bacterium]|nr:Wzt carbohydrate-binding domain-containing protein [Acidobacteriota bacterium]
DEAFAHRSLEKFSEFEKAGKTILLVSHDLSLVADRCRRAIWLDAGRLVADGPAPDTVARYRESVAEREGEKRLAPGAAPPAGSIGSGRARVVAVRVLDARGRPSGRLRSGEPASLEMDVRADPGLRDFVFGFALSTVAGQPVFGSNTALEGLDGESFSGEARVRLEIPALSLAPGVYSVDAAIHAADGAPYEYRRDVIRFEVTAETATSGVWNPRRRWRTEGGVRWKE